MNVVGMGKAGCAIAEALSKYPQYKTYKIDTDIEGKRCFNFPTCEHPEDYEASSPKMKTFFRGVKGNVVFIISGAAKIAGASLVVLEHLKHCDITILYIQPNCNTLEDVKVKMHNVCLGVLQEYARSGVFERLILIDNDAVDNIIGQVPIIGYYEKLNELIVWVFHMLNVLKNSEPVMGKINKTKETSRITTIGTVDFESGEEKMFFSLDKMREKGYFYLLTKEDLTSDGNLLKKITEQVKNLETEDARSSFAIYSSEYDQNYVFCMTHTPYIQRG